MAGAQREATRPRSTGPLFLSTQGWVGLATALSTALLLGLVSQSRAEPLAPPRPAQRGEVAEHGEAGEGPRLSSAKSTSPIPFDSIRTLLKKALMRKQPNPVVEPRPLPQPPKAKKPTIPTQNLPKDDPVGVPTIEPPPLSTSQDGKNGKTIEPRPERPVPVEPPAGPPPSDSAKMPEQHTQAPAEKPEQAVVDPLVFDQIRAEIKSRLTYFQACADAARRRGAPDVRRVQATWFIAADGTLKELKLEDVPDPQLALCITRMGSRAFPMSPGADVTIPTPIVFVR